MTDIVEYVAPLVGFAITVAPIYLFPAIGEIFSERAGIMNVGVEGYMLAGAFAGYLAAYYSGNPVVGILCSLLAGGLVSLIHGALCVTLGASQVVSGISINIFALGITGFWFRILVGERGHPWVINTFEPINVPFLSSIPVVGPILFSQNVLVYVGIALSILFTVIIKKTTFGLRLRATGEDPLAAETSGINVSAIRYIAVFAAGALSGIGGAYLSLAYMSYFVEGITGGVGFIALAIVIVSRWNPLTAVGVSLVFALTDSLQLKLQLGGMQNLYPFLKMIPYVLTMVILIVGLRKRSHIPKALNVPYAKKR